MHGENFAIVGISGFVAEDDDSVENADTDDSSQSVDCNCRYGIYGKEENHIGDCKKHRH